MLEDSKVVFCENASHFAVCLDHSFFIYQTKPLKLKFKKEFMNSLIDRIVLSHDGNIVAFSSIETIKGNNQYKLYIWSNYFGEAEGELDFSEEIMNLVMRGRHLLIILEKSICVYDIDRKVIHFDMVTHHNPFGVGDLSSQSDSPLIAVCGLVPGSVRISIMPSDNSPVFISAHNHALAMIRFTNDSSLIATASETGTLIRIFDCANGTLLGVFRRGTLTSRILSMSFSKNNNFLVVVSETGTAHMFHMEERDPNESDPPRAASKLAIGRISSVDTSFLTDNDLVLISSTGFIHEINVKKSSIQVISKTFILSH